MISTFEYLQLAEVCTRIISKTKIEDNLFFERLNDIRNLHKRYQSIVDEWIMYPHYKDRETYQEEKDKILMIYSDIKRLCKDGGVESKFQRIPEDYAQFRKQFAKDRRYVDYYFQNFQITDAIVFIKDNIKVVVVPDLEKNDIEALEFGSEEIGLEGCVGNINGL